MKVLYINPNINHHKLPFYDALRNIYGQDNVIYATPLIHEENRIKMGFDSYQQENWLYHIQPSNFTEFSNLFYEADIVLCSIRDYYRLMEKRLQSGKLTFYFSERWFKEGIGKFRLLHPKILNLVYQFRKLSTYPNFFYLAQGEYAAYDFNYLGICKNRIFSFGYFTSINQTVRGNHLLPKEKINLLWCGRMLKLKRVDLLIKAFCDLQKKNNNIHLTLVGNGPASKCLIKYLHKHALPSNYTLYDFLPVTEVRYLMQQADIYVLPSNGHEGWGAVINEAMAESCAIVGSNKIGAVKSMLSHGKNAMIFPSGNLQALKECISSLTGDPILLAKLKKESNALVNNLWSASTAAFRFSMVVDAILNKEDYNIYREGVMKLLKYDSNKII